MHRAGRIHFRLPAPRDLGCKPSARMREMDGQYTEWLIAIFNDRLAAVVCRGRAETQWCLKTPISIGIAINSPRCRGWPTTTSSVAAILRRIGDEILRHQFAHAPALGREPERADAAARGLEGQRVCAIVIRL